MKKYLIFIFAFIMMSIGIVKAENYKVGDLISYKDVKFYVMKDGGDYLTLLKATPLTKEEVEKYGNGHINVKVSDSSIATQGKVYDGDGQGYGGVAYYSSENCYDYDHNSDCKKDYEESDIKYIVDGWTDTKLGSSDLKSVTININDSSKSYKTRLLTKDELINDFGYIHRTGGADGFHLTTKTPNFVNMYTTWLMGGDGLERGYMANDFSSAFHYLFLLIRPVVNLNKTANIVKLTKNMKQITDTDFEIGDILEYQDIEFYVMKDNGNYLTLLKATPLTTEEVDNYGKDHINNNKKKTAYDFGGYGGIVYTSKTDCSNNTCSDYDKSDAKYVVDKWAEEIDGLVTDDLNYKARLLTYDELVDPLNYIFINSSRINVRASVTYDDIMVHAVSYWTMTPYYDYPNAVYFVTGGHISGNNSQYDKQPNTQVAAIRPVINLAKQTANKDNNFNSDKENKNSIIDVPNTLLKNPIFIVIIGIILISGAIITISVIIKNKRK